jgi:hypothetical protein
MLHHLLPQGHLPVWAKDILYSHEFYNLKSKLYSKWWKMNVHLTLYTNSLSSKFTLNPNFFSDAMVDANSSTGENTCSLKDQSKQKELRSKHVL